MNKTLTDILGNEYGADYFRKYLPLAFVMKKEEDISSYLIDLGNIKEPEDLIARDDNGHIGHLTPPLAYEAKNAKYSTEKREKIGRGKYRLSRNTYSIQESLEYFEKQLC